MRPQADLKVGLYVDVEVDLQVRLLT